ncbi:S8 family peptidase [Nocardioides seonyuensis]|uniref:S8 family peptidase n=1 Tax=Nocardioides seonyuensis TaxID=2518371 RepID=A0A4P7IH15_9ACTN|nr:S8 family peptidase [Nocardioides seonyuensis]QBX56565.1 S8 family peptidase [Nocardioides seonyuensis]
MNHAHTRWGVGTAALLAGSALALTPLASSAADQPQPQDATTATQAADGKAPLLGTSADDRYIVVFDKDASTKGMRTAKAETRSAGAQVTHTYSTVLDGFAAKLPAEALNGLRNNPHVAYIEPDMPVQAAETQSPATWGIDRIDQRSLPLSNSYTFTQSGAGVTAYIIDTGIRTAHAEFSGRAVSGYTAINDGRGSDDCNGHGTHVAGTVGGETYGVAQDVRLVAVRVLDCNGSGSNSGVIAGVDWVTQNHAAGSPAVANMSLGGGISTALDSAVNNSIADGVTYALAAGNDSGANACNGSPSRVAAGLTVGSTTSTDARSSFSNIGSCLDLFAPGSSITSAWHTSNSATNTISGTSMATPHVAGAAALYLQTNPGASAATVASALIGNATTGKVTNAGTGSPNRLLYTGTGGTDPGPGPDPEPTTCDSMPERESGSLSSGGVAYHPGANDYYYSGSGTHVGCLAGPSSADFDLYLEKWNGSRWVVVAQSISSTSNERISYTGTSGYYSWRAQSYSGSGSYTFGLDRP